MDTYRINQHTCKHCASNCLAIFRIVDGAHHSFMSVGSWSASCSHGRGDLYPCLNNNPMTPRITIANALSTVQHQAVPLCSHCISSV
jgi:hypothetical protein